MSPVPEGSILALGLLQCQTPGAPSTRFAHISSSRFWCLQSISNETTANNHAPHSHHASLPRLFAECLLRENAMLIPRYIRQLFEGSSVPCWMWVLPAVLMVGLTFLSRQMPGCPESSGADANLGAVNKFQLLAPVPPPLAPLPAGKTSLCMATFISAVNSTRMFLESPGADHHRTSSKAGGDEDILYCIVCRATTSNGGTIYVPLCG